MDKQRFDMIYRGDAVTIEPHFCREWDDSGGCYGTNPNDGLSFDEACDESARWREAQAELWRTRQHHMAASFASHESER